MILTTLLLLLCTIQTFAKNEPSCASKIYCQGDLLHYVQMARIFNDSKSFVDLKMKYEEEVILTSFNQLLNETQRNPTKQQLKDFVSNNFEDGDELEAWTPNDYNPNPRLLNWIDNPEYKDFAQKIINIWPSLAKRVKENVTRNEKYYSLIPVQNGFIIPGGRFKEFYYWDSYWIIRGLLLSEMYGTVQGMLNNFITMVQKFGFVPNGSRIYYLNRSQPPLLTLMVSTYIDTTNDLVWLRNNIHVLAQELRFWLKNRTVRVPRNGHYLTLARHSSNSGSPRPESYYEDYNTAASVKNKIQLWKNIKSGAETGWDFSSRWIFDSQGGNQGNLSLIDTERVIPVDLNSFLCQAFEKLSQLYVKLGQNEDSQFWAALARKWKRNIALILYDEEDGVWYDYDLELQQSRRFFYPSNLAPLWCDAYYKSNVIEERIVQYIRREQLLEFQGGLPTSLEQTGEQWDFPNAWPPLQSIVIFGLAKCNNFEARNLAKIFAERWLWNNFLGFNRTGQMFEKYSAVELGVPGEGGEYVVQSGFGWSNGVVLELLNEFYTKITLFIRPKA